MVKLKRREVEKVSKDLMGGQKGEKAFKALKSPIFDTLNNNYNVSTIAVFEYDYLQNLNF